MAEVMRVEKPKEDNIISVEEASTSAQMQWLLEPLTFFSVAFVMSLVSSTSHH